MCAHSVTSVASDSVQCYRLLSLQATLPMGSWSGLPFPHPGRLPDPGGGTLVSCTGRRILHHRASWEDAINSSQSLSLRWGSLVSVHSPGSGSHSPELGFLVGSVDREHMCNKPGVLCGSKRQPLKS